VTNSNFEPDSKAASDSLSVSGPNSASDSGPSADAKINSLSEEIGAKAALKLKAQRSGAPGVWFGLGMTGLIGWSVVVPTLLGTAFGVWLDSKYPGLHSWTLMGLAVGIFVGCLNAWHWVQSEDQAMHGNVEGSADSKRGPLP
jgi:ATP synthase protein I